MWLKRVPMAPPNSFPYRSHSFEWKFPVFKFFLFFFGSSSVWPFCTERGYSAQAFDTSTQTNLILLNEVFFQQFLLILPIYTRYASGKKKCSHLDSFGVQLHTKWLAKKRNIYLTFDSRKTANFLKCLLSWYFHSSHLSQCTTPNVQRFFCMFFILF